MKLKNKRKNNLANRDDKTKHENTDLNYILLAANSADEKQGENILVLDVSRLTVIADYFLIISTKSTPQIIAIANYIEEKLSDAKYKLVSKEGFPDSSWTILDYGNFIVHIMHEKERAYYKLEKFWSNATVIDNEQWKKWKKWENLKKAS